MRAGLGAHRHGGHAGELHQPLADQIDQREAALHGLDRLQWVDVGEAGQASHLLVQARIMLHRAAAEREQAEIDRVILAAEAGIMADDLRLGEAGQADRPAAFQPAEPAGDFRRLGDIDAGAVIIANLEDQAFLQHQRPVSCKGVAGEGGWGIAIRGTHFGLPPACVHVHASASVSASARAATSSSATVSVTATTSPLASASTPG